MQTIPNEMQLREHLIQATAWVKEQLRRADLGMTFTLSIEIRGPIQQEEGVKLEYSIDCYKNSGSSVRGNSLSAVTWELLRRMGWEKANQPLELEFAGAGAPGASNEVN